LAVFGFFVYQTLFADSKPKNSKSNPKKTKISDKKESIKKEPKKGLFNRKSKPVEENLIVQKKGLFGRKKEVINLITKKLPSSQVFVENIKGNDHLQVTVIASEFDGLSLVKQHQLVYAALKEELASEAIHALALKTETPI